MSKINNTLTQRLLLIAGIFPFFIPALSQAAASDIYLTTQTGTIGFGIDFNGAPIGLVNGVDYGATDTIVQVQNPSLPNTLNGTVTSSIQMQTLQLESAAPVNLSTFNPNLTGVANVFLTLNTTTSQPVTGGVLDGLNPNTMQITATTLNNGIVTGGTFSAYPDYYANLYAGGTIVDSNVSGQIIATDSGGILLATLEIQLANNNLYWSTSCTVGCIDNNGFFPGINPNSGQLSQFSLSSASDNVVHDFLPATSAVPLPSAIWLFGTGVVGMSGLKRRKK